MLNIQKLPAASVCFSGIRFNPERSLLPESGAMTVFDAQDNFSLAFDFDEERDFPPLTILQRNEIAPFEVYVERTTVPGIGNNMLIRSGGQDGPTIDYSLAFETPKDIIELILQKAEALPEKIKSLLTESLAVEDGLDGRQVHLPLKEFLAG